MDLRIEVTTEKITLKNGAAQSSFSWLDTVTVTSEGFSVKINREAMVVSFGEGITFKVVLHQVWKKHHIHLHFLGFYVLDSDKMSTKSHGLLGQFFRPLAFQVSDLNPGNDPSKIHAIMLVKKHRLAVTRCGDPSDILTLPTNKPGGKSPLCPHTLVQQALSSVGFPHFPLGSWAPRGPSKSGKGQTQPPRRSNHATSFLARELWNWQRHTLFQPWSMS
ncbi:PREDICTED: inter-alpha-trypsin inhibitor heavy chain H3-like, partial [Myotis davidii]|uniref:inter-alpha-trypsin inhibitor heavy chain H3-like n=1 Tax=Myotis davidii TaxID=225400 RepID=UPI0003EC01DD